MFLRIIYLIFYFHFKVDTPLCSAQLFDEIKEYTQKYMHCEDDNGMIPLGSI